MDNGNYINRQVCSDNKVYCKSCNSESSGIEWIIFSIPENIYKEFAVLSSLLLPVRAKVKDTSRTS